MTKSLLGSLKVIARPENTKHNPLLKNKERLLTKLDVQKPMAQAHVAGETYTHYKEKWQMNPETKLREKLSVPKNIKAWFYKRNNRYFLEVRHGNKALELQKGMHAIDVGDLENLVPTIETVIKAVVAGELDKFLTPIPPINKVSKK